MNAEYVRQVAFNNSISGSTKAITALKIPKFFKFVGKFAGPVLSIYDGRTAISNYNSGKITKNEMFRDLFSSGMSAIPVFGTGWGFGWELGQKYGPSTWYGTNDYKYFE